MGKDPVTATRDVRAAVEKELGFDPRVDAAHISVRNIGGDVTLAGTVPSYPQYLAAAAAARRVAGVSGVHNHLEVVLPEGAWRDDVATWPGSAPPRRSPSSSRTCATTGTTRRVPDRRLEFRPPQRRAARPDRARRRPRRRGPALPADPAGHGQHRPVHHYSLLRSIEDIFGLPHLGNAAMARVRSFGPDVFG